MAFSYCKLIIAKVEIIISLNILLYTIKCDILLYRILLYNKIKMENKKLMKRKLISKTYLKDVNKYELNIYFDKENYYLSVKKFIDVKKPFVLQSGLCVIDNGYYMVEVIPKEENYTMRIYFNEKKERVQYYFDITLENGLDEESNIPYYDDLYLDITIDKEGKIKVLDEDELLDALNKKEISKKEFDLANRTKDLLLDSIKNKNNKYMGLDLECYLN